MGKAKQVHFKLIPEVEDGARPVIYQLLDEVREQHHDDLEKARIALAWRRHWKNDLDGHLVLGKCVKASDLQKEFADYDFVILLNAEVWASREFDDEKKRALLDHELCHAARAVDEDGCAKFDERGRPCWRIRKHDVEEFSAVVAHYGLWKGDLQRFAEMVLERQKTPLLA